MGAEKSINGKEGWKDKETLKKKLVIEFNKKYNTAFTSYDQIIPQYKEYAFSVLSEMYVEAVHMEKTKWNAGNRLAKIAEERARKKVNKKRKTPQSIPFDMLPKPEKDKLIEEEKAKLKDNGKEEEIKFVEEIEAKKIALLTVNRILELQKYGKIRSDIDPKVTPYDILFYITEEKIEGKYKQEDYLVEEELEKWYVSFCGTPIPRTPDGKIDMNKEINVYCFQCGDLGAGNFMTYGGNIGPNNPGEGYFCFSEEDYNKLISDRELFDENGICKDVDMLSARLGNVPLGYNPICIKRTIKIGDLRTSNGGLSTAYFGEFGPPITTQGGFDERGNHIPGMYEAVVPSTPYLIGDAKNPNIEIISHSKNISTDQLRIIVETYIKKSREFIAEENQNTSDSTNKINSISLARSLDRDIEILKKFRATLTEIEQQYISQLMVYLQGAMQREEVAAVGMGAK